MSVSEPDEPIRRDHDRLAFDCGVEPLNQYLARYARQNHESGSAKTFVTAVRPLSAEIAGYYTLGLTSLAYEQTPVALRKGLARYEVPVFRLGRLAVDIRCQGRGIGGELLARAVVRCMTVAEQVSGIGLLIDAKDQQAARWYASYGAVPLPDQPMALVLPFSVVQAGGGHRFLTPG